MSLQWTLVAGFLYLEMVVVLMMILPVMSPMRWQKFFKSRFLQQLRYQSSTIYYIMIIILVLFFVDAVREIFKYTNIGERTEHAHLDAEMQGNMKLFRAQRNLYISGFSLYLGIVIHRLAALLSTQAVLLAQSEAAMRQAQSATTTARSLLSQKPPSSESAQNDSNETHDKVVSELKHQIKELQAKKLEIENELTSAKKDRDAIKSQSESLAREYDRLNAEHAKLQQSSGDKKTD